MDGRTVGRSVGHVITKFSGMGRFIYPWCSAINKSAAVFMALQVAVSVCAFVGERFLLLDYPTEQLFLHHVGSLSCDADMTFLHASTWIST